MSGRRRMMMQARGGGLPSGYTACEYLESNGSQWIVTDFIDDGVNAFEVTGLWINYSNYPAMFGARVSNDTLCGIMADLIGSRVYYSSNNAVSVKCGNLHTYKLQDKSLYIDNVLKVSNTGTTNTNKAIYLFGLNYTSADLRLLTGRIYDFKVIRNGEITNHLLPCYRKADHKAGMYDIVSHRFLINSGSGDFIIGQNV